MLYSAKPARQYAIRACDREGQGSMRHLFFAVAACVGLAACSTPQQIAERDDKDCQGILEACCSNENSDAACSDGIDNDGNGYADCLDFGCSQGMYVTVCVENTDKLCSDGKDNDGDKSVDCADSGCKAATPCLPAAPTGTAGPENTLTACSDNFDNDGNGYKDCGDFSCSKSSDKDVLAYCALHTEGTLATCTDGKDNDGNGWADCADRTCMPNGPADVVAYCASIAEATYEKCSDKFDNDGNGFMDCADYSCSQSLEPWNTTDAGGKPITLTVTAYCASILEATFERCSDKIDNDGNGHTDCQDYSCSRAKDLAVRQACQESLVTDAKTANDKCSDNDDNDKDGYTDCADWDCAHNPLVTVCNDKPKICGQ